MAKLIGVGGKWVCLQPRFGFSYDLGVTISGYTTLRGGVGVFSGGDPTVLFSNSYTNNGIVLDDVDEDEREYDEETLEIIDNILKEGFLDGEDDD